MINWCTAKPLIWDAPNPTTEMFLVSSCRCLCPIHWSMVLFREWRYSWSSADRRYCIYILVINKFIAYYVATYVRGLSVDRKCDYHFSLQRWYTNPPNSYFTLSINKTYDISSHAKLSVYCIQVPINASTSDNSMKFRIDLCEPAKTKLRNCFSCQNTLILILMCPNLQRNMCYLSNSTKLILAPQVFS